MTLSNVPATCKAKLCEMTSLLAMRCHATQLPYAPYGQEDARRAILVRLSFRPVLTP